MKLGVLYSGGKDSTLALVKAKKYHEITCLISIVSQNKESFMFHTPNIEITKLQAEAMQIPLISFITKGEKEKELDDLKKAIILAKKEHKIEGIITGAVASTYQASRIQQICKDLDLWCFNPLWLLDQVELLNEVVGNKICAIIGGVFAEAIGKEFLGKIIDKQIIFELSKIAAKHKINPAGEGGEIETTVLDAPIFLKKIEILKSEIEWEDNCGTFLIKTAELVNK